ncbi:TetR/AcrR family transcriptional regulator [Streptomyces sp. NPDC058372]|uniref:TetR/AcrR family transcriptional regulator n=1 Tax=unclassified Streptomyces TaxID=2593676 RepID=UPI00364F45EA
MSGRSGPRGPYRKGVERRNEIVRTAAQMFSENGYVNSSMRELAKRVGLTQTGFLHHFADKEELLVEVLGLRDGSIAQALETSTAPDVAARSREVARHAVENDGLTSLFVILAAEAASEDHPAHAYFTDHYRAAQEKTLERDDELSVDASSEVSPEMVAALGTAVLDGLLLQRRYRDDLDIVAAVDAFWRLVAAARHTWSQPPAEATSERPGD